MDAHIKALNPPIWAEMLTACQEADQGCGLSLVCRRKSDTVPEAQDQKNKETKEKESRVCLNDLDDS